jgi:UDP-N-acetylmuramyl pentapeptide phosphotransferase/UDP-N-acetylglucosamine-1-phosphate transferase
VALQVDDMFILITALMVAGATAGFLIWNYPVGLIFLGDGGAYFIGFMLGELALMLVMRNPEVSTWYAALLLIYPAFETIFSAYRRMFVRGKSPAVPDGIHLHSLIFRRLSGGLSVKKKPVRCCSEMRAPRPICGCFH